MLNVENTVGMGKVVGWPEEKETQRVPGFPEPGAQPCVGDAGSLVPTSLTPHPPGPEAIVLTLSNPSCWRLCPGTHQVALLGEC